VNETVNKVPRVTVLLPVYNAAAYVSSAIESILKQSFTDFELLVINDGSSDNSLTLISKFNDPRIRVVNNEANLGLIATLNKGLELAKSELIARMDADDSALPDRLQLQVAAFDQDPNLVVCGTNYYTIEGSKRSFRPSAFDGDALKAQLLFTTCFSHPTIMMKHPLKEKQLMFESEFVHCEDYRFWTQFARFGNFRILPQPLLEYRIHIHQITAKYRQEQVTTSALIRRDYLRQWGLNLNSEEEDLLNRIGSHEKWQSLNDLKAIETLSNVIIEQNKVLLTIDSTALQIVLQKNWIDCCGHSTLGLKAYRLCITSPLTTARTFSSKEKFRLLLKCLLRKMW
jgi:glycosyltransferase involved in cell wall biosynthesis